MDHGIEETTRFSGSARNPPWSYDRSSHELHFHVRRATVSDLAHHLYHASAPLAGARFTATGNRFQTPMPQGAGMIDGAVVVMGQRPEVMMALSFWANRQPHGSYRAETGQQGQLLAPSCLS